MTDLLRDFRHSIRLLARTRGFTAVAVLVLTLGIGVNVGIFSIVNALVLQPRPGRIDSLVGVFNRDRTNAAEYRGFSYPAYVDLRDRAGVFESVLAQSFTTLGVRDGELTRQAFGAVVSANYFDTLGVKLAAGRPFSTDEESGRASAQVAIASYGVWRQHNLDPAFLGSTVRINGRDHTVVGVVPKGFGGVMAIVSPQWWVPIGAYDRLVNQLFKESTSSSQARDNYGFNLVGALRPGVTPAAADAQLDTFAKQLGEAYPSSDRGRVFFLGGVPRMGVSTRPQGDGPIVGVAALLMTMAVLVLTIACVNLANLLLARGVARRKEIAIRQALGSGRSRIIRQLLVEGLTLSLLGAAGGLLAGWWTTAVLGAWLAGGVTFGIDILVAPSLRLITAAAALAIVSTVLFALGPAWSLSRPDVSADLKGERENVLRRGWIGSLLVPGQLAISLALVAAAGLFTRAAINVASLDGGFSMAHQLVIGVDAGLAGYDEARTRTMYRAALERLRSLPGVEAASLASTAAFGDIRLGSRVQASPNATGVEATSDTIGAMYFETLGLRMLRGREFAANEEQPFNAAATPAIINVRLARMRFQDADPLGRTLLEQSRPGESPRSYSIVGVAPDLRHDLFEDAPRPHIYVPYGSRFASMMTLHVRAAASMSDAAQLGTIRRELQAVDNQLPILSAKTMTAQRDTSIGVWMVHAAATLFGVFGALALVLAVIGVYGLRSYEVGRRTREIGIRMALGATAGDVQRLILSEGGRTTTFGLLAGVGLAVGVGKLASGILLRVSPFDPIVLTGAAITLTTAALLAAYVPARKAARVVPLDALRTE